MQSPVMGIPDMAIIAWHRLCS